MTLRTVLPQPSREESPDGGDLADQRLHVAQRHVVDLDVLAGRDVALVERRVLFDDVGEGVHLLRRDAAEGELDADHLHVGLALAVDALFEAEADELGLLGIWPARNFSASLSKSSNSRSMIGMMCPGTFT